MHGSGGNRAPGLARRSIPRAAAPGSSSGRARKLEGTRMMNGKAVIPLVAGLCIGGFALKMVFDTVKKAKGAQTQMAQVFAAKVDIPLGTKIDETMVMPIAFPAKSVPQGAFTTKDRLLGRVPKTTAVAGLPILDVMLHPEGAPPGLWVKKGFRAIAVKIDDSSGVDNHLFPGAFVDVVGYFNVRRGGKQETVARTIVENVEVAAVGQRLSLSDETGGDAKKKPQPARAVTLFVKPEQVPIMHLAEQRGKIKLSMRNSEEMRGEEGDNKPKLAISEGAVTGQQDEEPADKKDAGPGLSSLFANLFQPKGKLDPAKAAQAIEETPKPPVIVQAGWVTKVYHGDKMEEVLWKSPHSRDRFIPPLVEKNARAPQKSSAAGVQPPKNSNDEKINPPGDSEGTEASGEAGVESSAVPEPEESPG